MYGDLVTCPITNCSHPTAMHNQNGCNVNVPGSGYCPCSRDHRGLRPENGPDSLYRIVAFAQWQKRDDYGPEVEAYWPENSDLQAALLWECETCPDGGWAEWERIERIRSIRLMTAYITCGHCGTITETVISAL
jgi:hypothetical protein